MSGRPVNDVYDRAFVEAMTAHARGSCDAILALATVRSVPWDDALRSYPAMFQTAAADLLERIAKARDRKGQR